MLRVLVLGGTLDGSHLAQALAQAGVDGIFSYAGRTHAPIVQPLPTRVGGFGGVAGLQAFLLAEKITHVVDATHPFAAQMSSHAVKACASTGVPLLALERPAWQAQSGDAWQHVPDIAAAVQALPAEPARVFLAIGRQHLMPFLACAQHWFLLRLLDPVVDSVLDLPPARGHVVLDRGPFTLEGDRALLQTHRITHVVSKNAGGVGAQAKLTAARERGLPVVLIGRPVIPARPTVSTVNGVLRWMGVVQSY
ncbi:cobalt-precorrin-6A reductase [Polaromonas sp. YR568]|uniref:cobalt-precorrin-6A reductase n=1 Tax=Polaromonas sp. YR568 TaxID=1855301 RepID=UPI003137A688